MAAAPGQETLAQGRPSALNAPMAGTPRQAPFPEPKPSAGGIYFWGAPLQGGGPLSRHLSPMGEAVRAETRPPGRREPMRCAAGRGVGRRRSGPEAGGRCPGRAKSRGRGGSPSGRGVLESRRLAADSPRPPKPSSALGQQLSARGREARAPPARAELPPEFSEPVAPVPAGRSPRICGGAGARRGVGRAAASASARGGAGSLWAGPPRVWSCACAPASRALPESPLQSSRRPPAPLSPSPTAGAP